MLALLRLLALVIPLMVCTVAESGAERAVCGAEGGSGMGAAVADGTTEEEEEMVEGCREGSGDEEKAERGREEAGMERRFGRW